MKEMKHIRPTCVKKCFNKHLQAKGEKTAVKCAVEAGGGKEGASRKDVENDGERYIFAWDVGILSPRKKQSKEVSAAGRRRKAGRNTRSVAAGIASKRILGASEMLP